MKTNNARSGGAVAASTTYAKVAGALIVVGYLTYGLPDVLLIQPILDASDPLTSVATNSTLLTTAALVKAINSAAVVGISLFLYPILRQHSESIALGYVATRVFEGIVMVGGVIALLLLVPVSGVAAGSGADPASLQAIQTLAVEGNDLAYHVAMIALCVGSLPFCYLLYRARLVPRALAVLGLIGYPIFLVIVVLELYGGGGGLLTVLYVPGMAFELGLAVWLLRRGIDTSGTVSDAAPSAPNATRSSASGLAEEPREG